jgi:hypothetical protein
MKQHLVAFGAAAQDYSAGLVTVPFIADGLIRASSNIMQLNDNWDIVWSFFGGIGLTRVRLNSAQSRIRGYPNLTPFQATSTGGDNPIINDLRQNPIKLYQGENVTLQATNGAPNIVFGALSLSEPGNTFAPPPPGARRIRFTASPTSVAYGWSAPANIVLDDDLEAGIYEVHGMMVSEATTLAARLVFKDQVEKPGVIANQALTQRPFPPFLTGMGKLGEFYSLVPPFIEVLANAAAAITVTGYLLANKVR